MRVDANSHIVPKDVVFSTAVLIPLARSQSITSEYRILLKGRVGLVNSGLYFSMYSFADGF